MNYEFRIVFDYLMNVFKYLTPIIIIFLIVSKILSIFVDFVSGNRSFRQWMKVLKM